MFSLIPVGQSLGFPKCYAAPPLQRGFGLRSFTQQHQQTNLYLACLGLEQTALFGGISSSLKPPPRRARALPAESLTHSPLAMSCLPATRVRPARLPPVLCLVAGCGSVQRSPRRRGQAPGCHPRFLRARVHREQPAVRLVCGAGKLGRFGQAGLVEENSREGGLHCSFHGKLFCSCRTEHHGDRLSFLPAIGRVLCCCAAAAAAAAALLWLLLSVVVVVVLWLLLLLVGVVVVAVVVVVGVVDVVVGGASGLLVSYVTIPFSCPSPAGRHSHVPRGSDRARAGAQPVHARRRRGGPVGHRDK